MFASPRSRVAALVVLLAGLFGLVVWYGTLAPAPDQGAYPSHDEFLDAPHRYLGDRVVTAGRVTGTDPVLIAVERGLGPPVELAVTGVDHPVEEGNGLRVFGRLVGPREIAADESFAVPEARLAYTYVVSFLAGLWVLARVVRTWRFDRETAGLVPRSEPLSLSTLLEDRDA